MSIHAFLAAALIALPARAEPTLRARARAQDYSSLPVLRDALKGSDAAARAEAAFALGQLGMVEVPEGDTVPATASLTRAAAVQALAPAASDPDPAVRRAAVEALGKVGGADAEASLMSAATDIDAGVRGEAALALFRRRFLKRVPEYSTAAFDRLALLAADADPEVRWRALYAFSRWPEPRAAKLLAAAQKDSDERARLFAVRGLGKIGAAPDPALLDDVDVYVRADAVSALSAAKAWKRIPDSAFADLSAHVRAAAVDAAADSRDAERFLPLVRKVFIETGTLAPGRAVIALARLGGDSAALDVARAQQDQRWWMRARAYEAAAFLPEAESVLRQGVQDPDPRVAGQALETLAASTAPIDDLLAGILFNENAPVELLGPAIDAASERATPKLVDGLFFVYSRTSRRTGLAELREDARGGLRKSAAKIPERSQEILRALEKYPAAVDKARRFRSIKSPPEVVFETEKGNFTIALAAADDAGNHAAAFVDSVKRGLYDGLIWHRVVTGFVVQGGDPTGSGWGDAGWRLADEINRIPFLRGTVGMPKAGKDTGGCQLFVTLVPTPHLDGRYTAFGHVVYGMDVFDRLEPGDKIIRARLQ